MYVCITLDSSKTICLPFFKNLLSASHLFSTQQFFPRLVNFLKGQLHKLSVVMKNMLNNSFSILKRKFHYIFHPVFYDSNSVGVTIQGLNDFMNRYCTRIRSHFTPGFCCCSFNQAPWRDWHWEVLFVIVVSDYSLISRPIYGGFYKFNQILKKNTGIIATVLYTRTTQILLKKGATFKNPNFLIEYLREINAIFENVRSPKGFV